MKRSIAILLFFVGYQLLFGALALAAFHLWQYAVTHYFSAGEAATSPSQLTFVLTGQVLGQLAIGLHVLMAKDVTPGHRTFAPYSLPLLLTCILLIVGMGCWTNYLTESLGLPDINAELIAKMLEGPLGIFSIAVLAPVVEELVFRGAIQGQLMRRWRHPAWAIVASSLIFGVIHGNPMQIPFAFVTGLVLGWVYYRTGSLLPSIVMHLINNSASVVLFHLSGKQSDTTLIGQMGETGALSLALAGAVVTAGCLFLLKRMTPQPATWHEG